MPSPASYLLSAMALSHIGRVIAQTNFDQDSVGTTCPGVLAVTGDNDGYCCVGGELNLSTCEGWPICRGPQTEAPETTSMSCATKIALSESDYTSLVESASSRYLGKSGNAMPQSTGDSAMPKSTSTEDDNDEPTSTEDDGGEPTSTQADSDEPDSTSSGSSASETDNGSSSMRIPGLASGAIGGMLALWMLL
ncbi:hypothetical protein FZEAL_8486 [Fusarium zealandicum]|uniref:Uncharacterized protein n=1 Tax=Fusarium zealandicum TaxID=1053134 RepID=A0A8H4UEE1_9HYPO|nr:hypothetical protein FZEAL_8486 [Fusarium zealandicum]